MKITTHKLKSISKLSVAYLLLVALLWNCKSNTHIQITQEIEPDEKEVFFVLATDTTIRDGLYLRLNLEGDTLETIDYKQGVIEGQRILYYPDGTVKTVENYINNEYNGSYQTFYENGAPKQIGNFQNNQFTGELKSYYETPTGRLRESVYFVAGEEDGPFKQFYPNGQLEAEGHYQKGQRSGEFKEYHPNGELAATGRYLDDIEDGEIKIFDTTGVLIKIYIFEDKKPVETIYVEK